MRRLNSCTWRFGVFLLAGAAVRRMLASKSMAVSIGPPVLPGGR